METKYFLTKFSQHTQDGLIQEMNMENLLFLEMILYYQKKLLKIQKNLCKKMHALINGHLDNFVLLIIQLHIIQDNLFKDEEKFSPLSDLTLNL